MRFAFGEEIRGGMVMRLIEGMFFLLRVTVAYHSNECDAAAKECDAVSSH
jgi:hypothetical protein